MSNPVFHAGCCGNRPEQTEAQQEISRRAFLAAGGVLMGGLSFAAMQGAVMAAAGADPVAMPAPRKPLIVKPVLIHNIHNRPETLGRGSWRNWGDILSLEKAEEELARIRGELAGVKQRADYPVEILDVARGTDIRQFNDDPDFAKCDVILCYGAGHNINGVQNFGKDVIMFQRWNSGAVYRHIITISARILRQHTDEQAIPGIRHEDVVVDDATELDWRFRALCGLKNTRDAKIITIGGAGAWASPYGNVPEMARNRWGFEYHDVPYPEMRRIIEEAKADSVMTARAQRRAEAHLRIPGTRLETTMQMFTDGYLLDDIFRVLMKDVGTNNITVNSCMQAIMPASRTTACYTLTTLLDDGYQAMCESDFVAIPGAILLGNITGKPFFWANPCFPYKGTSSMAHCSAPRKMDGRTLDPVRIMTHYESDFGAAPWVEFQRGMTTTSVIQGFRADRWVGFGGVIEDVPANYHACRSQMTIRRNCSDDELLADNLIGFHWITVYGDYRREIGYALRRVGIQWNNLDRTPTREMEIAQTPVPADRSPASPAPGRQRLFGR